MAEIINIPAGVLQPADILKWLNGHRNEGEARWTKASQYDDFEQMAYEGGYTDALTEVIRMISEGRFPGLIA